MSDSTKTDKNSHNGLSDAPKIVFYKTDKNLIIVIIGFEILYYFISWQTNASAESLNSKIKCFRTQVKDIPFFMHRIATVPCWHPWSVHMVCRVRRYFHFSFICNPPLCGGSSVILFIILGSSQSGTTHILTYTIGPQRLNKVGSEPCAIISSFCLRTPHDTV